MADDKSKKFKPYTPGRMCPKCNSRMAAHKDRYTCGKCGYTEFKGKDKKESTVKEDA